MNQLSGYIELEMGGEILPFKFGTNAWALFCEERGIEYGEIASSGVFGKIEEGVMTQAPSVDAVRDLFYAAHRAEMRSRGKDPMVNKYRFIDLLDDTTGALPKLFETMTRAKMMGYTAEELAGEQKKIP